MNKIISLIIFLSIVLSSNTAHSFDEWRTQDTILQLTYTLFHAVDYKQTRWAHKERVRYEYTSYQREDGSVVYGVRGTEHNETNPILGKHPSQDRIDIYFASTLLLHAAVSYMLPQEWRPYWQGVTIALECGQVVKNYKAGISLNF